MGQWTGKWDGVPEKVKFKYGQTRWQCMGQYSRWDNRRQGQEWDSVGNKERKFMGQKKWGSVLDNRRTMDRENNDIVCERKESRQFMGKKMGQWTEHRISKDIYYFCGWNLSVRFFMLTTYSTVFKVQFLTPLVSSFLGSLKSVDHQKESAQIWKMIFEKGTEFV
jgi:hypothetical protein